MNILMKFLTYLFFILALLHYGTTVRASQAATQELLNVTSIREIRMHANNVVMLNIQTHEFYTGQYSETFIEFLRQTQYNTITRKIEI